MRANSAKGDAHLSADATPATAANLTADRCGACGAAVDYYAELCPRCRQSVGVPNRRRAQRKDEVSALRARYHEARQQLTAAGCAAVADQLEHELDGSRAVVNLPAAFLRDFLDKENTLYNSYKALTDAGQRKHAEEADHRKRSEVEAKLFPGYEDKIIYAAVALDGRGLHSYGEYVLLIDDVVTTHRASVLETNSYRLVELLQVPLGADIPPGHRATWEDRKWLIVAKIANRLTSATTPAEFPRLLLFCSNSRETDEFVEVHIYGSLDIQCFQTVIGPRRPRPGQMRLHSEIKDRVLGLRKSWNET